jgi:hypothetical protein
MDTVAVDNRELHNIKNEICHDNKKIQWWTLAIK